MNDAHTTKSLKLGHETLTLKTNALTIQVTIACLLGNFCALFLSAPFHFQINGRNRYRTKFPLLVIMLIKHYHTLFYFELYEANPELLLFYVHLNSREVSNF